MTDSQDSNIPGQLPRYRILAPLLQTEGAERILWYAAAIARSCSRSEVVVTDILEVPYQTSFEAAVSTEEFVADQQTALELARIRGRELGIDLRTRAIIGHDRTTVLQQVIRQEQPDHLVIQDPPSEREHEHCSAMEACPHGVDTTVVTLGSPEIRRIVSLISETPHAIPAARRAFEFAEAADTLRPTLLNVQPPGSTRHADPRASGQRLIRQVAQRADIPPGHYHSKVLIDDRPREALVEAVEEFDTICLGASQRSCFTRRIFGSLPSRLRQHQAATVVTTRARFDHSRSFLEEFITQLWR